MFEKKFCKNCKVTQIFSYLKYCRVCQENYQAYQELLNEKLNKFSKFKGYVEENILSKINSKQLLMEARRKQIERLDEERLLESRNLEQLKNRIREPDDPITSSFFNFD